jgi:hypothetical protein
VAKIVIDHKDVGSENQRTQLRFFDEHGEEATAITLCIWGVGSMASRTMPKITLIENGVERELAPLDEPQIVPLSDLIGPNLTENE